MMNEASACSGANVPRARVTHARASNNVTSPRNKTFPLQTNLSRRVLKRKISERPGGTEADESEADGGRGERNAFEWALASGTRFILSVTLP